MAKDIKIAPDLEEITVSDNAIALCSKAWLVEQVLNRHFRKRGHIE